MKRKERIKTLHQPATEHMVYIQVYNHDRDGRAIERREREENEKARKPVPTDSIEKWKEEDKNVIFSFWATIVSKSARCFFFLASYFLESEIRIVQVINSKSVRKSEVKKCVDVTNLEFIEFWCIFCIFRFIFGVCSFYLLLERELKFLLKFGVRKT